MLAHVTENLSEGRIHYMNKISSAPDAIVSVPNPDRLMRVLLGLCAAGERFAGPARRGHSAEPRLLPLPVRMADRCP